MKRRMLQNYIFEPCGSPILSSFSFPYLSNCLPKTLLAIVTNFDKSSNLLGGYPFPSTVKDSHCQFRCQQNYPLNPFLLISEIPQLHPNPLKHQFCPLCSISISLSDIDFFSIEINDHPYLTLWLLEMLKFSKNQYGVLCN